MTRARENCSVDDCPNAARRAGLCWTHLKRKKRGIPLEREVRGYRMTKRERISRAIALYANAETDEDFRRADALLEKYTTDGGRKRIAEVVRQTALETVQKVVQRLNRRRRSVDIVTKPKMSTE